MMRHNKGLIFLFLIIVSMMLFTACAKDKELHNDNADNLPELIIGSDDYKPYNYIDDDGNYAGVDVELAEEACRRMGYKPVFKQIVWENKDYYLANGEVDCLWGSFTMTGREDMYRWVGPYLYSKQAVVVSSSSDIYTLSDLAGKRVAVQATTKAEDLFLHNIESELPQVEQVNCFSSPTEIYAALRKNYVDAIAGHEAMLSSLVKDSKGAYRMLEESPYKSELGVAFKKGTHEEIAEELTETLKEMQSDGITKEIVANYGLDADEILPGGEDK